MVGFWESSGCLRCIYSSHPQHTRTQHRLSSSPPPTTKQPNHQVFESFEAAHGSRALAHKLSMHVAPSTLEWQGVGCSYQTPAGVKEVLADVWGVAQPGEMQALLGPSGAGKSTFMDILALRKSVGTLSGRLLVNGARATKRFIKQTAYVPQEDNFVPTMTAWEVMNFYAEVRCVLVLLVACCLLCCSCVCFTQPQTHRAATLSHRLHTPPPKNTHTHTHTHPHANKQKIILPRDWPPQRRKERIREVLAEVGLAHAHRTIVGGALPGGLMMRGLSGGERKRLAIATGILAAPSVLFLDEPTSGLDSFAALTVMGYLRRMVREQNHVVVASIHQPRSAIWLMFDAVTLLASGRLMYHGPRDGVAAWFGSLGYAYDPLLHGVPSDW
jgi:ABC-type multidrug transport system ATPase subunit